MKQKYVITIGYTKLAFDEAETAMRAKQKSWKQ